MVLDLMVISLAPQDVLVNFLDDVFLILTLAEDVVCNTKIDMALLQGIRDRNCVSEQFLQLVMSL